MLSLAENYSIKEFLGSIQQSPLPNSFRFNGQQWMVIDSSAILPPETIKPVFLLLTQSPRIHLDRILSTTKPDLVVADGSNYTTDVARWKKSCYKMGIPFFSTSEKGAYFLKN
jgi:competence protein ComEC